MVRVSVRVDQQWHHQGIQKGNDVIGTSVSAFISFTLTPPIWLGELSSRRLGMQETESVQTAACEKEPFENAAGAQTDNR